MPTFFKRKTKSKNKEHKVFRRDIQALRAFAVVAVVLYHLWPDRMIGGFTGVDIFFVISGYLMTVSIMRHLTPLAESHSITPRSVFHLLTEFYARRIRRLVPAALAVVVGILALSWLTGNLNVLLTNAKNAVAAATFWQNWYLANDSLNYLQQDNLVVATQHFWSLSLEEQFYLMWPLLLVFSTLITTGVVVAWKMRNIPSVILPVVLATLASIAYGTWLTKTEPTVAYYDTFGRVWELMIGGVIALLPAIKNYDTKLLLPYLGLGTILYSIFFISGEGFPGWHALIPTIGTAMIIWGGTHQAGSHLSFDAVFRWRPIQWIGNISYSIYLWHFPFIILLPILLHRDLDGEHGKLFKLGIVVLTLILAHLSYRYIEQSTQRIRLKTRYIYLVFIVATGLVVVAGFGLKYHTEHRIDTALKEMHAAALDESNVCFGARAILNRDRCGDPYGRTSSQYAQVASDDYFRTILHDGDRECPEFESKKSSKHGVRKLCVIGDRLAEKSILLIGDSHAGQYINAFDLIGRRNNYRVVLAGAVGCYSLWNRLESQPDCAKRNEFILNLVKSKYMSSPGSFIVLSLLFVDHANVSKFIKNINDSTSKKIVLLGDNPRTTEKKYNSCIFQNKQCSLPIKIATKSTTSIANFLVDKRRLEGVSFMDINNAFCTATRCYSSVGGVPVYSNVSPGYGVSNSHITASFSLSLGPFLEQKLRKAGVLG